MYNRTIMQLFDTHCHIQSAGVTLGERSTRELWAKNPEMTVDSLVAEAKTAQVTKMICVGCDLQDSKLAIDCVKSRENLYASIGLHPHEAQHYAGQQELLYEFSSLVTQPKVVAIGECGLDFYYTHSPKADQIAILEFQIQLALDHDLPLIFHVREAFDDFWPVFDSFSSANKPIRGVLHSFTDSQRNMEKAVAHGLYIGVNGIATFAKQPEQQQIYKTIPDSRLLLETDAPFLTPVPFRGTICQPKHIVHTAEYLAGLRNVDLAKISSVTTENARKLFNL